MSGFYIKQICASGEGVRPSSIDFNRGVNIVHGVSNTGKTLVISCIDFMLGAKGSVPFDKDGTGYDTVSMVIADESGTELRASRKIVDGDEKPKGGTVITVSSGIEGIESGDYNISYKAAHPYNEILLKLLGIDGPVKIIQNQKKQKQALTVRSFRHQFLLHEDEIITKQTIICDPGRPANSSITPSLNALMYLITGEAADDAADEDPEIKKAKKKAVLAYINSVIVTLSEGRAELQEELAKIGNVDIDAKIDEVMGQISDVEASIAEAVERNRIISSEIMRVSEELGEMRILADQYRRLHTQYDSDVSRLNFIVDGEEKVEAGYVDTCPFCENEITKTDDRESYRAAAKAELEKTLARIADLELTESDTAEQIAILENQISELERQRANVVDLVNRMFKPRAAELRSALASYQRVSQLRSEIDRMETILEGFEADVSEKEGEDTSIDKFDAKEYFDKGAFRALDDALKVAVSDCKYPAFKSARLAKGTFDLVINGRPKELEGKGYRAYLNSIFAFTLMKFLEANGQHPPKLVVLDSPILNLVEKGETPVSDSMKSALMNHMIANCGECQVIIAENELQDGVDYSTATLIPFTKNRDEGRYGFLLDYHDPTEEEAISEEGGRF
ncbi:ATP-binding protein [Gordonibacter sp. Marseille-P4307]|uniref:ATP-binding protein n=1 Tax=Gordonibacter sp. Marseille-P4307 TaxID=2161815 RepID=UPI000F53E646|nr:ATP-binding protein [Gordonibacter sp. Marseille-P4307]